MNVTEIKILTIYPAGKHELKNTNLRGRVRGSPNCVGSIVFVSTKCHCQRGFKWWIQTNIAFPRAMPKECIPKTIDYQTKTNDLPIKWLVIQLND